MPEKDSIKSCPICDTHFKPHGNKRYCSRKCSRRNDALYGGSYVDALCEACSSPFRAQRANVERGGGRFCSRDCYTGTPESRFWSHVKKSEGCWIWTAGTNRGGYGKFSVHHEDGTTAHRFSWELHNGSIPDGLMVLHSCDNPPCVRPDHLFIGTHMDNCEDAVKKGRTLSGERNPSAILTVEQVLAIRLENPGGKRLEEIGADYGVAISTVYAAKRRLTWKNL